MGKKSKRKKEKREKREKRLKDKSPCCLVCRYKILTSEKIMIFDEGEVHLKHLKYYREAKERERIIRRGF